MAATLTWENTKAIVRKKQTEISNFFDQSRSSEMGHRLKIIYSFL